MDSNSNETRSIWDKCPLLWRRRGNSVIAGAIVQGVNGYSDAFGARNGAGNGANDGAARDNERGAAPNPEGAQDGADDAEPMSRIEAIQRLSAGLSAADRRTRSAHLMAIHALAKLAASHERRMRRIRAAREAAAKSETEGARDGE